MNAKKFCLFATGMGLLLGLTACGKANETDPYYEYDYEAEYEDEYEDDDESNYEYDDEYAVDDEDDYEEDYEADEEPEYEPDDEYSEAETDFNLDEKSVGDIIALGSFEQDNNEDNGPEPLEWIILSKEEGKTLIITKNVLDYMPYNENKDMDIDWDTCTLKRWLNTDFFNNSFSETDQIRISSGDEGTIFCLSLEEADKYFGEYDLYSEDEGYKFGFLCSPSKYALRANGGSHWEIADEYNELQNMYNLEEKHNLSMNDIYGDKLKDIDGKLLAPWWLRDGNAGYALYINSCGLLSKYENRMFYDDDYHVGIRPAMYISY